NKMMQSKFARRSDVHGGTFADSFHAAEHFYRISGVVAVSVQWVRAAVAIFCVDIFGVDFRVGFCFDDGRRGDSFGCHYAPWRMPDSNSRRALFQRLQNEVKLLKLLTLTAKDL